MHLIFFFFWINKCLLIFTLIHVHVDHDVYIKVMNSEWNCGTMCLHISKEQKNEWFKKETQNKYNKVKDINKI